MSSMVGGSMSEIVPKDSGCGWFSENKGIYHGIEGANVGAISIVGPFNSLQGSISRKGLCHLTGDRRNKCWGWRVVKEGRIAY